MVITSFTNSLSFFNLSLHPLDMFWALLGIAGCFYPIKVVWPLRDKPSSRDFIALMLTLGLYPLATAVFHLTPFDLGLSFLLICPIPAIYFFAMIRYLGLELPHERILRRSLYSIAAVLALLGTTNAWHGQFAVFASHVEDSANHLLFEQQALWGLRSFQIFSAILVLSTLLLALLQLSRTRFNTTNYAVGIVLPALGLWVALAAEHPQQLFGVPINGFVIVTTAVLLATNHSIITQRFLEFRVISRSTILAIMPEAMLVLSPGRHIVDTNPAFEELTLGNERGSIDKPLHAVLPELNTALKNNDSEFEFEIQREAGRRVFQVQSQSVNRLTSNNTQTLLLLRDITTQRGALEALEQSQQELREANAALQRLSMTDALTGLKNRRWFQDRLEAEYERLQRIQSSLALVSIDVDHFKSINDNYGHGVGDQALCHVARVLEQECRNADTLARVGGEEFMVLLLDAKTDAVNATAQRLCRALREAPFALDNGGELRITASLGFSLLLNGDTIDAALRRADSALYNAKRAGRDQVGEPIPVKA